MNLVGPIEAFQRWRLSRRLTDLVRATKVSAVTSYISSLDRFPELKIIAEDHSLERWDYFFSVASLGCNLIDIINGSGEIKFKKRFAAALSWRLSSELSESHLILRDFLDQYVTFVGDADKYPEFVGQWFISSVIPGKFDGNRALFRAMGHFIIVSADITFKEISPHV